MQRVTLLIATLIAAAHTLLAAAAEPSARYYELVEQADKAVADMKWNEAAEALQQAMRLEPTNPSNVMLMSNLGMMQYYAGNDSLAVETLSMAHRIAPASVTVLQNKARVLASAGRTDEALADYAEVIRLDSTLVEPRFYHAMLSIRAGDTAAAHADIDAMKRLHPDHESTALAESAALVYESRYAEAIPLLDKLLENHPTADDYSTRAMCHLMLGHLPEASEDIARGIELDPTNGELYFYRAMLNKMRFRPDDARADAEQARRYGVDSRRIKALEL